MQKSSKILFILLLALILSVGAYAFAASNTVPGSVAGDGEGAISGITITDIHYNISNADPSTISSVVLTTSVAVPATVEVQIKLVDAGTTWYTCAAPSGTTITCTTTGADVVTADKLRVLASD
jgi:hypothetical protein